MWGTRKQTTKQTEQWSSGRRWTEVDADDPVTADCELGLTGSSGGDFWYKVNRLILEERLQSPPRTLMHEDKKLSPILNRVGRISKTNPLLFQWFKIPTLSKALNFEKKKIPKKVHVMPKIGNFKVLG